MQSYWHQRLYYVKTKKKKQQNVTLGKYWTEMNDKKPMINNIPGFSRNESDNPRNDKTRNFIGLKRITTTDDYFSYYCQGVEDRLWTKFILFWKFLIDSLNISVLIQMASSYGLLLHLEYTTCE